MNSPEIREEEEKLEFENALVRLQQSVKQLESGELSLEESLKTFEEGVRLTRLCQKHLSVAEQKVELLIKVGNEGMVETQTFAGMPTNGQR